MRLAILLCSVALALPPLAGCGDSSSPSKQSGARGDYGSLFKSVTREVSKATAVLRGVHRPGDIAGARETLDTIAARIERDTTALKSAPRPDQAGYEKLRPAAEALSAELKNMSDEERRAAGDLGADAMDLARATLRTRTALFQFTFDADPMKAELERAQQQNPPPGGRPSPPPTGAPGNPTAGPFGPSMPGGRPSDPGEAGRQSLAAFRNAHDVARTITVEVEGIPAERLADLCWRLKAQTGATVHASTTSGGHTTVLLYPVPDLAAAGRQLDVGRITGTDQATRTISIAGDPSKLQ